MNNASEVPTGTRLDLDAYYTVKGYRGMAFAVVGYATKYVEGETILDCENPNCEHTSSWCWYELEGEEVPDYTTVRAIMVGDDREHFVALEDLTPIAEDDFCHGCGQIGCGH